VRSKNKKPEANLRQSTSHRSASSVASDKEANSAQLQQIAKVMGNQHLRQSLQGSAAQRDTMLAHICERLSVLQGAQSKERQSMSREREWFKGVAKGADGYHLPDLTRWHESAELYKKAGDALCSGNLGRGADLVNQAAAAEEAAFDSVPKFVKVELDANEQASGPPEIAQAANDESSCAGCAKPGALKIADTILAIQDKMESTPPLPVKKPRWFDEELEEEEEEDDEDNAE
jgi:hypothetical protein